MCSYRVQEFEAHVTEAFASITYPGDDSIGYDSTGYDPESAEIALDLRGKPWAELSKFDILRRKDSLALLTPEAFMFYLPAYLVNCAKYPFEVDTATTSLRGSLTPPSSKASERTSAYFRSRTQSFSQEQCRVIVEYLDLAAEIQRDDWATLGMESPEMPDIERALAWWRRRAEES